MAKKATKKKDPELTPGQVASRKNLRKARKALSDAVNTGSFNNFARNSRGGHFRGIEAAVTSAERQVARQNTVARNRQSPNVRGRDGRAN